MKFYQLQEKNTNHYSSFLYENKNVIVYQPNYYQINEVTLIEAIRNINLFYNKYIKIEIVRS